MNTYSPPLQKIEMIHMDDTLLVVNKPAGLLSVPGRGETMQDCLISRVQADCPDALIVHRLDMGTSGLMVLARGKLSERALSIQFQRRLIHKRYQAVVWGIPQPGSGEVDLPLLADWPNRPRQKVDFLQGKPSRTVYQVLAADVAAGTSRLQLTPLTGRSHQLRVHLHSLGHPILGDELYAPSEVCQQAKRLLLHAGELGFTHPQSGESLRFSLEPEF